MASPFASLATSIYECRPSNPVAGLSTRRHGNARFLNHEDVGNPRYDPQTSGLH